MSNITVPGAGNDLLNPAPAISRATPVIRVRPQQGPITLPNKGIKVLAGPENAVVITRKERDELLAETARKEAELPLLTIVKSAISLYSWEDLQNIAGHIQITNTQKSGNGSVNDPRMGVVDLNVACQYCGQVDCPGHYGLIRFGNGVMIYNPATIREVIYVLTCVCADCGGLLITEDLVHRQGFTHLSYDRRLPDMSAYCKDHECLRQKPQIGGGALVPCAKNPVYIATDVQEKGEITYKVASKDAKKVTKEDPIHPMPIERVEKILNSISIRDAWLLGFPGFHRQYSYSDILKRLDRLPIEVLTRYGLRRGEETHRQLSHETVMNILDNLPSEVLKKELKFPTGSHPRNMIMHGILVPPQIARPSVIANGTVQHDQLTIMYITIMNKALAVEGRGDMRTKTSPIELYNAVKQLLFASDGKKMGTRDILPIVTRIQGKNALLRGLLMGKRNNYCARTVAGPDPSLKFGQVRIPEAWRKVLTKKIPVTNINFNTIKQLMVDGEVTHIISKATGARRFYDPKFKYDVRIGDVVERWLQNGDRIIANRQPTLHRQSMMGYEAVLGREYTIGFHLSTTTPMNLDFDGDEGNIWDPQDFEVEAETEILLNVKNNIMSSEQNRPIMGYVMNSVTAAYLLTMPNVRINDDLFKELLEMITSEDGKENLYERLQKYGVHPRSGQAIFSALLPNDFTYEKGDVVILEGILIGGRLKKAHVGTSNRSIVQELHKKYGPQRTANFLTDGPWILNKWIIERGFSVGLLDMINFVVDPVTGEEYDRNVKVLKEELAKVYVQLEALGGKVDDPTEEQYRQKQIINIVNISQGIGLRLAKEVLAGNNAIGVMTDQGAGTKGGVANIGQMMGSVGQQFYRGERLKPTLSGGRRLLPSYDLDDNNPEANAFIPQSFFTGISPQGLFFLQAGGREGILDTALGTAKTGAMQHRLIKALENAIIGHDGSIRNTIGTMFAPMFNAGYDIAEMVTVETPGKADFTSFFDPKALATELNLKRGWIARDMNEKIVVARSKLEPHQERVLPINPNYQKQPAVIDTRAPDTRGEVPVAEPVIKLSKYEHARIIGARAMQLSNNAPPRIDIGSEIDPVAIAMAEYQAGELDDFFAIRKFPDGSHQEVHPVAATI
jgi:DNA-directed RNA polymerase subunit A'